MKISASVLAADQITVLEDLKIKQDKYHYVHVDIGDNEFCPTYGISHEIVYKLVEDSDLLIDMHFMTNDFPEILNNLLNQSNNVSKASLHAESNSIINFLTKMSKQSNIETGIGVLASSDLNILKSFIDNEKFNIHYILLLCVEPGFSNQTPIVSPVERVKEFNLLFPNYDGEIMVDGGVKDSMLEELKELNVDISVQGGAIFG
tara:strand:+ start:1333 stop:1944 length:612 start_codon:yes stop_codon:yes gene_type:complete